MFVGVFGCLLEHGFACVCLCACVFGFVVVSVFACFCSFGCVFFCLCVLCCGCQRACLCPCVMMMIVAVVCVVFLSVHFLPATHPCIPSPPSFHSCFSVYGPSRVRACS